MFNSESGRSRQMLVKVSFLWNGTKCLIAFWNEFVFTEDATAWGHSKSSGFKSHQGWIFNFFAVSSKQCWEWGCDTVGWGRCSVGHHLTYTATSLGVVSDGADMKTVVCHKCGNRQGWRGWRRKVFGCRNCVCVEEILTYVTFVNGNKDDFQTVVWWWCTKMDWAATAVRILVYFSRHTGM